MIQAIKFWYFRWRNGYPSREEIRLSLPKVEDQVSNTIRMYGTTYYYSRDIAGAASFLGITRERLKQGLWKIYYRAKTPVVRVRYHASTSSGEGL